jgi:hypothetical protein
LNVKWTFFPRKRVWSGYIFKAALHCRHRTHRIMGTYTSRKAAEKRLRQIKFFGKRKWERERSGQHLWEIK